jgi:hypothetical protein
MNHLTAIRRQMARNAARLAAIVLIALLYGAARTPVCPEAERAALAARFRFMPLPLPELPGPARRSVRAVNPSLSRISAWISSVGASVALNDLDGNGLPDDVCYVDVRTDRVIVAPAPGTPARYKPFVLDPGALPYDPATMAPMGVLPGDFNEDGLTDILVYYWGRPPILFLRRDGPGDGRPVALKRSLYVARELLPEGSRGERWFTNAMTQADLDGDGHIDLVVGNYFPDGARILDAGAHNSEEMQDTMSRAANGGSKRFLLWSAATAGPNPTVTYREAETGLSREMLHGWTLALGAADLDGDGLPELYIANDFGPDRLLYNRSTPGHLHFVPLEGRKTLTTPSSKVLGRDSFKGMGVDFGDINGDGLPDIYVSNIAAPYALEESHFLFVSTGETSLMKRGIAPYVDRSEALGLSRSDWAWDAKLADFDNDGTLEAIQATGFVRGEINRWPELHELAMGNDRFLHRPASWLRMQPGDDLSGHPHTPFFVRASDGRYYDLSQEIGLTGSHVTRGIAIADIDGDGRLDFATANQWEASALYRNISPHPGAFLGLHLRLPLGAAPAKATFVRPGHPGPDTVGRPAIGAAATVTLPDGRRLVGQVDGGNGHSGKRSPDLHFGLGQTGPRTRVHIALQWRDSAGRLCRQTLELTPGWHTVLLGQPEQRIITQ